MCMLSKDETRELAMICAKERWDNLTEEKVVRVRELMSKAGLLTSYFFLSYIKLKYGMDVALRLLDAKTLDTLRDELWRD